MEKLSEMVKGRNEVIDLVEKQLCISPGFISDWRRAMRRWGYGWDYKTRKWGYKLGDYKAVSTDDVQENGNSDDGCEKTKHTQKSHRYQTQSGASGHRIMQVMR